MLIGDTYSLGKAFSTCVLHQMGVPLCFGSAQLGFFGMLNVLGSFQLAHSGFLLTEEEKTSLFGLRA